MNKQSFEEKQAFAAKTRARNYAASLKLEGMKPSSTSASMSKDRILNKYRSQIEQ